MAAFSTADFVNKLLLEFPNLREEIEEDEGLPHVQMGSFARTAQQAKSAGDWETYSRCVKLADHLFGAADDELRNALYVSFLEHLDFDGPSGQTAWDHLTPRLQRAWEEVEAHWRHIMRRKSKD